MPQQASNHAPGVDWLFYFILGVCIFFFLLIVVLMAIFTVRYRHKAGARRDTAAGHSTALELTWTIIPTILVLIMFYYGLKGFLGMAVEPPGAMEVQVQGQKWSWLFTYPNGVRAPDLYLVKDEPVRLMLESSDVIHSLYIPAFRVKKDVVPGRFNRFWLTPTVAGEFEIYCAEYCGQDHSAMRARAIVLDRAAWETKMKELSRWDDKYSPIDAGRRFYEQRGCKGCHSIDGTRGTGPSFKDLYGSMVEIEGGPAVRANDDYIRESILEPTAKLHKGYPAVMPSFKGQFSGHDLFAIISFFKSISTNVPPEELEPLRKITPQSPTTGPATQPAGPNSP
jgi:cytochrome c oxidase subunit 2